MKTTFRSTLVVVSVALLVLLASLPLSGTMGMNEEARSELATRASAPKEQLFKKSYALLIGESVYKNWRKLPGAELDVKELEGVLKRHGFEVTVVMNPTRVEFDQKISDFKRKMDASNPSRFLFYFSGHGYTATNNGVELGYIVPSDAPLPSQDRGGFMATAISMNAMDTLAREISPSHALFVFDSCFSGSLFTTMRGVPEPIVERLKLPVRLFITAGTDKQTVPDNSVFRKAFVKGLNGEANRNRDQYVTGTELGEYLFEYVTTQSKGGQTPRYGPIQDPELNQGDFIFELPPDQVEPFKPFPLGSHYYPSGWMDDLAPGGGGKGVLTKQATTIEGRNMVGLRIEYKQGNKGYGGIYWQHPNKNWGDRIGFSLVGAKRISFYAKGEKGGEIVEFISGGIESEDKPYKDRFRRSTGELALTTTWTKYVIDLSDLTEKELSSVIGAFAWVASGGFDKEGRLVTYIADLKVE